MDYEKGVRRMYNYYFDYKIKNASDGKELSKYDDIMFYIDRLFDDNISKFCYRLVLCIRRKISESTNGEQCVDTIFGCEDNLNEKDYLSIIHFKPGALPSNRDDFNSNYYSLFEHPNSDIHYFFEHYTRLSSNKDDNKECYYLKYVLDIPEENISSIGMIGFSSSLQECPSLANTYFYEIEFYRKKHIFYSIEKSSKKLKITIKNIPQVPSDIKFVVAGDSSPIYKFDNNILDGFELEMKAGSASRTIEKEFELSDEQSKYNHFRLAIKTYSNDDENEYLKNLPSKLFLLYPLQAPDIKDKTDKVERENVGTEKKICPFCAQELNKDVLQSKHLQYCDGELMPVKFLNKKGKKIKKVVACKRYNKSNGESNPTVPMVIPPFLLKKKAKTIVIGLSGAASSGKSVFLSSLLKLQNGVSHDLTYLNAYTSFYKNNFELVDLFYVENKKETVPTNICDLMSQLVKETTNSTSSRLYDNFKMNYLLYMKNKGGLFQKTGRDDFYHPFIFKSNHASFVIKDFAGEILFEESENYDNPLDPKLTIDNSDAYLVLIKPNQTVDEFGKTLSRILNNQDNKNKPIAIVLSKFDLFIQQNQDKIDPSLAALVDDTYSLMNLRSYSGSLLEKNVERASEEIKAIIKDTIKSFPFEATEGFTNVKYFAISSLGGDYRSCPENLTNAGDSNNILGIYLSPYRIELPILWILQQTGIIM